MSKRQPRLFISYSHSDKALGEEIARRLKRLYDYVWFDQSLTGGQLWWKTILEHIADCDILVYLMDQESLDSSFCRAELTEALRLRKQILPVVIHPQTTIPDDLAVLRDIQYVDMMQGVTADSLDDLYRALVAIERQMVWTPIPDAPPVPDPAGSPARRKTPRLLAVTLVTFVVALLALGGLVLSLANRPSIPTASPGVIAGLAADLTLTPDPPVLTAASTTTRTPAPTVLTLAVSPAATAAPQATIGDQDAASTLIALHVTQTAASMPTPDKALTAARIAGQTETAVAVVSWTKTPTVTVTWTPTLFGGGRGPLTFVSARDGRYQIYAMDADGSNQRKLAPSAFDDLNPAWSPDGTRLAFASDRDQIWQIYVVNADGSNPRNVTNTHTNERSPAWSPDGKQIVFYSSRDGHDQLYVMNADGTGQRKLSQSPKDDNYPMWSPDGRQIAFFSDRDGHNQVYVMNADGSSQRNISQSFKDDWNPAWSPDGKLIAFQSNRDGYSQIYVMNADGGSPHNLSKSRNGDESPIWSPDGTHIAFDSNRGERNQICVMDADGGNQRNLSNNTINDWYPRWQP